MAVDIFIHQRLMVMKRAPEAQTTLSQPFDSEGISAAQKVQQERNLYQWVSAATLYKSRSLLSSVLARKTRLPHTPPLVKHRKAAVPNNGYGPALMISYSATSSWRAAASCDRSPHSRRAL